MYHYNFCKRIIYDRNTSGCKTPEKTLPYSFVMFDFEHCYLNRCIMHIIFCWNLLSINCINISDQISGSNLKHYMFHCNRLHTGYFMANDLSIASTKTKYIKLNTKTQNIFCRLNENLTTFLYTLSGAKRKQKEKKKVFSLKCIQKSNVIKKKNLGFSIWIYVFGFSRCNGLIISLHYIGR